MKTELIIALDVDTVSEAFHLVGKLENEIEWYKVGPVLFTEHGPSLIERLKTLNKKVMLDLKFHDIPNTVGKACLAAKNIGVDMLTVHLSGGKDMLIAASQSGVKVLGISVLTSIDNDVLNEELNIDDNVKNRVLDLIELGIRGKVDGIVCSAKDTKNVREHFGQELLIINPGIRVPSGNQDDQKRIITPKEAANAGANYIVMGRSIYQASDPAQAVENVLLNIGE